MMNPDRINVAIVDDHTLVREGLALLLGQSDDIRVSIEAGNGREFMDQLEGQKVDVVLLDLEMPVMNGKEVLLQLKEDYPEIYVIILTMHQHDSFIANMMKDGADGYLLKGSKSEEVIDAIRTVKREGIFFNPITSRALLGRILGNESSKKIGVKTENASLNQRELDILKLICSELTTAQIAEKLFLSPKTIEGYRKSLLEKTKSKNVVGMVKYAMKHKLV